MKIAITSQNFKTITGHAGKTRRFIIYDDHIAGTATEIDRLNLPKEMSMHENQGSSHPIDIVDVLITASCGNGFVNKMASRRVQVIQTSESDPLVAATAVINGEELAPAEPHSHSHAH